MCETLHIKLLLKNSTFKGKCHMQGSVTLLNVGDKQFFCGIFRDMRGVAFAREGENAWRERAIGPSCRAQRFAPKYAGDLILNRDKRQPMENISYPNNRNLLVSKSVHRVLKCFVPQDHQPRLASATQGGIWRGTRHRPAVTPPLWPVDGSTPLESHTHGVSDHAHGTWVPPNTL